MDNHLENTKKKLLYQQVAGRLTAIKYSLYERIKYSCSYGTSENQEYSHEVVIARELSKKLNTRHEFIELNNFFDLENEWYKLYGPTTHLNGHYHIEFLKIY